jgi:uncharacterized protein YndB with AHSA1/START domain
MPERTSDPFLITRRLAAPRSLVFSAFTQGEHLKHWMGPEGFTMSHCAVDLRPGGVFHYRLVAIAAFGADDARSADAQDLPSMWGLWTFREIVPPERLVVVTQFSDAVGGLARSPFPGPWPLRTLSTTTFDKVDSGTLVTLRWQALDATDEEERAFAAAFASMTQGWSGTFEQLEDYLALQTQE